MTASRQAEPRQAEPRQAEPLDELSRRLTSALTTAPAFEIPGDFAARTAMAAAKLPPRLPVMRFSRLAIQCAFAAILLTMLGFAAQSHALSTFATAMEMLLALELAALITWVGLRPQH